MYSYCALLPIAIESALNAAPRPRCICQRLYRAAATAATVATVAAAAATTAAAVAATAAAAALSLRRRLC